MTSLAPPAPAVCPPPGSASAAPSPGELRAAEALARVFKALGDPVRLRLAGMIAAREEVCVCELTPAFELSSGTISHHLRTLREAGLIDGERRGTFVYYWIAPGARALVGHLLGAPAPEAAALELARPEPSP